MTENLAGRGEGLAGLAEAIKLAISAGADLRYDEYGVMEMPIGHLATKWDMAQAELQRILAALEAAAPAGTAPQTEVLAVKVREVVDDYVAHQARGLCTGRIMDIFRAALATPSPQAPTKSVESQVTSSDTAQPGGGDGSLGKVSVPQSQQEQCNAFSTTSAREQSSATASDSLDVAAQTILKPHWPSVRNMEESEARRQEVLRVVGILNALTWQAAKEESDKWYEACRNPRADDPRAYCIAKAVRK